MKIGHIYYKDQGNLGDDCIGYQMNIAQYGEYSTQFDPTKAELIVLGGGGLINEPIPNHYRKMDWKSLKAKIMIYAVGLGPFYTPEEKKDLGLYDIPDTDMTIIPKILKSVDVLTVRDKISLEHAKSMGVKAILTADPVFNLKSDFPDYNLPKKPILLCIADYSPQCKLTQAEYMLNLDKLVASLQRTDLEIHLMPFYNGPDMKPILYIKDRLKDKKNIAIVKHNLNPTNIQAFVRLYDLVVTMRLHPMIIAATEGIPVIGLENQEKLDALALELETDVSGYLVDFDNLYACRKTFTPKNVNKLQKRELKNKQLLEGLL